MADQPVLCYQLTTDGHYACGRRKFLPAYFALAPSSSSMRRIWLYLASRSLRHGAPVLICTQVVTTNYHDADNISMTCTLFNGHLPAKPALATFAIMKNQWVLNCKVPQAERSPCHRTKIVKALKKITRIM